jgi:hypothetical protein
MPRIPAPTSRAVLAQYTDLAAGVLTDPGAAARERVLASTVQTLVAEVLALREIVGKAARGKPL